MVLENIPAGLEVGKKVDVRVLEAIANVGEVSIILYFEEDLGKNSTYDQDMKDYISFQEHERPFIEINLIGKSGG